MPVREAAEMIIQNRWIVWLSPSLLEKALMNMNFGGYRINSPLVPSSPSCEEAGHTSLAILFSEPNWNARSWS